MTKISLVPCGSSSKQRELCFPFANYRPQYRYHGGGRRSRRYLLDFGRPAEEVTPVLYTPFPRVILGVR
jgi:hypothetical protein